MKTYQPDEATTSRWEAERERGRKADAFKAEAARRLDDLIDTWVDIQRQLSHLEGDGLFSLAWEDGRFNDVRKFAGSLGDAARDLKSASYKLSYYVDGPVAERHRDVVSMGHWREDLERRQSSS